MHRLAVLVVIISMVASCAVNQTTVSPKLQTSNSAPSGFLVGSIVRPEKVFLRQVLKLRDVRTKEEIQVAYAPDMFDDIFGGGSPFSDKKTSETLQLSAGDGLVFSEKIPAGEYELYNFELLWTTGQIERRFSLDKDVSIRIVVRPGMVTYLGEFTSIHEEGKNPFGMSVLSGGHWSVADQSQRDLNVAAKKFPEIQVMKIDDIVDASFANLPAGPISRAFVYAIRRPN